MIACSACCHRHEVGHPTRAAQRASAGAYSAYASCLLARTYLFHLYSYLKHVGKHLDKLTEIHAFVGNIVENSLIAVALILHIAYLHIEVKVLGYLARAYHSVGLLGLGFFVALEVAGLGLAEHSQYLGVLTQVGAFHLQLHQLTHHRHSTDIVAGICLHCHHIAYLQWQMGAVAIVAFAGVLECNFHYFVVVKRPGHIAQPVVAAQFAAHLLGAEIAAGVVTSFTSVALRHCLGAATASPLYYFFFLFFFAHRFILTMMCDNSITWRNLRHGSHELP